MVEMVQCPRGQEHNPAYFHLPFFIGDRLIPAHMRSQLPPARNPTSASLRSFVDGGYTGSSALGEHEVAASITQPTQLDRIEAKLDALLEALADEGEDAQQEYTLDGEAVGGERDDSQPL